MIHRFFLLVILHVIMTESESLERQFVAVVFRHGNRAPDRNSEMFPNDKYLNDTFFPMGLGGLTNTGKAALYKFGSLLRERYKDILGDTFCRHAVKSRSTDYQRTQLSLQLVHAGLFPPKGAQVWNPKLMWQPIPFTVIPSIKDNLMVAELCPQYLEEIARVRGMRAIKNKVEKFTTYMQQLTKYTGKKINSTYDMYNLYLTFVAEENMGLKLPEWAIDIGYPNGALLEGILLEYKICNYNVKLRRLFGGMLLKNIVETMSRVVKEGPDNRQKLHLFSGHETNIVSLLYTLNIFDSPQVPKYASAVILELLSDDNEYFIQLYHYPASDPSVFTKKLVPNCDDPCPFDEFVQLMSLVIPSEDEMICKKTVIYESAPVD